MPIYSGFTIENGDFPSFFVCLPEGMSCGRSQLIFEYRVDVLPTMVISYWGT